MGKKKIRGKHCKEDRVREYRTWNHNRVDKRGKQRWGRRKPTAGVIAKSKAKEGGQV